MHGRRNAKANAAIETAQTFRVKCQLCKERFSQHEELHQHQQAFHPEFWAVKEMEKEARLKESRCTICGKQFSRKINLERHMFTHMGGHPYKCEVCGVAVSDKGKLRRHMMIHTGDYPYRCTICDKGFRDEHKYQEEHNKKLHPEIYSEWKARKMKLI